MKVTALPSSHKMKRKIVALTFLSLDGVMQAPGGKGEDDSSGFEQEGWSVPYFDEDIDAEMSRQLGQPYDLLLGRVTYDIFAEYWPRHPEDGLGLNKARKYVVSNGHVSQDWKETIQIKGDVVAQLRELKQQDGPTIQVHGSGNLLQTLLANDLVDELWLKIFPLTIGKGKRLFGEGTRPAAFKLTYSKVSTSGVIIASFVRAGDVELGTFRD